MYTIAINLPDLPKGMEVEVDGLGVFANEGVYDITDEQAAAFSVKHQTIISDTDPDGTIHYDIAAGPSLEEAFANHPHIKVKAASAPAPVKAAKDKAATTDEGSEN